MTALAPTRWEVGTVDDLGINSTNFYRCSSKESVQKVVEIWQGEVRTRVIVSGNKITHRYVDLLSRRGNDLGKRFTYTKDLESITKTVHRDDVITALYGFGKGEEIENDEGEATGGYGRRIDFEMAASPRKPLYQWGGTIRAKTRSGMVIRRRVTTANYRETRRIISATRNLRSRCNRFKSLRA